MRSSSGIAVISMHLGSTTGRRQARITRAGRPSCVSSGAGAQRFAPLASDPVAEGSTSGNGVGIVARKQAVFSGARTAASDGPSAHQLPCGQPINHVYRDHRREHLDTCQRGNTLRATRAVHQRTRSRHGLPPSWLGRPSHERVGRVGSLPHMSSPQHGASRLANPTEVEAPAHRSWRARRHIKRAPA